MVTQDRGKLPISRACSLTDVTRSGYYRSLAPRVDRDALLRADVLRVTEAYDEYGYRRVTPELRALGHRVNAKRVLRVMRAENRLCTVRHKRARPRTTDSAHDLPVYPDRARGLVLTGPDQLWVADISYLRLAAGGFVYLASLMDAWSRRIVSWEVLAVMDVRLPLRALEKALAARAPAPGLIHHSDRGCQYAAREYVDRAESAGLVMSMGRKGQPRDNPKAESLFATVKCEHVYRTEYEDLADAREQLAAFVARYNNVRRHSSLGYRSPASFEAAGDGSTPAAEEPAADRLTTHAPRPTAPLVSHSRDKPRSGLTTLRRRERSTANEPLTKAPTR
jgi:putative transposase